MRRLPALGAALALVLVVPAAPAAATVFTGAQSFPGDLILQTGDELHGDLQVAGTLTVPAGNAVPVHGPQAVTITAAHIVIAGTLDGRGGAGTAGPGAGGAGTAISSPAACGGGAGGSSVSLGGSGGGAGGSALGGTPGLAYASGAGSSGGAGASCGAAAGGTGGAGGAAILLSAPIIEISGAVLADGQRGANGATGTDGVTGGAGGGGGSGGEIRLSGTTVLSGTLSATGGPGGNAGGSRNAGGGGAGSGGRIVIDGGTLVGRQGYVLSANQSTVAPGGFGTFQAGQPGGAGGQGQAAEVTLPVATTTTVTSSANPSTSGQEVTFTATVAPSAATGRVSFTADGTTISGCDDVAVGPSGATCPTTDLAVGTHDIAAEFTPDPGLYDSSTGTLSGGQEVQEASAPSVPQSISFPPLTDRLIGEAPFALAGVSGGASGNPVTFTAAGPCSVTGTTVTLAGVGTCTITADQAGGGDYLPAPSVSRSFAIGYSQRVLSISAASRRGGLVAVVLRLTDAAGRNVSAADIPVRATAIDGGPLGTVFTLNPAQNFPYSRLLDSYTFTSILDTGLSRGPHTLTFTAGADPRLHSITFTTR